MKKFENILLAADVDGTFSWDFSYVNPKNFEAIEYFKENGGKFLFSSGRNTKDIHFMINKIEDVVNAPCVLCNGSLLYDIKNDVIENPYYLDSKKILSLLGFVREYDKTIGWRASNKNGFVVCKDDQVIIDSLTRSNLIGVTEICDYEKLTGKEYFKCVFTSSPEKLEKLLPILKSKYPDFVITRSTAHILEIQPNGITKAVQLSYLKNKYSTRDNKEYKLVCIGDYDNDIDMLKSADVSFCPENANDKVKNICNYMVCHCKDGAVADVIYNYLEKI